MQQIDTSISDNEITSYKTFVNRLRINESILVNNNSNVDLTKLNSNISGLEFVNSYSEDIDVDKKDQKDQTHEKKISRFDRDFNANCYVTSDYIQTPKKETMINLFHYPGRVSEETIKMLQNKDVIREKLYSKIEPRELITFQLFNPYHNLKMNLNIKIATWNLLADALNGSFSSDSNKTFKNVNIEDLILDNRIKSITAHISFYKPDILLMQECDYPQILKLILNNLDYKVTYLTKVEGHCKEVAEKFIKNLIVTQKSTVKFTKNIPQNECLVIAISNKLLNKFQIECIIENVELTSALCIKMIDNSGKKLMLINVHLKSGQDEDNEEIRKKQIEKIFKNFKITSEEPKYKIFICGDFNSDPCSNAYKHLVDDYLREKGFLNVIQSLLGNETWTSAKERSFKNAYFIDHFYYRNLDDYEFRIIGCLKNFKLPIFNAPNEFNPSDHQMQMVFMQLLLKADFRETHVLRNKLNEKKMNNKNRTNNHK